MSSSSLESPRGQHARLVVLVSVALWLVLATSAVLLFVTHREASPSAAGGRTASLVAFSHVYPPDPVPFERPAVGTQSPFVDPGYRLHTGLRLTSIAALSAALPPGTVNHLPNGDWLLTRPIQFGFGSSLTITGPVRLDLAPGTFILAEHQAVIALRRVTVAGVTRTGGANPSPRERRGYIDARSGARLVLSGDRFLHLGYLGDQTYGLTLDGASSHSSISHCTVIGNYFGVYVGRMAGAQIVANHFVDSVIYGIDPHTHDTHLTILNNVVSNSGVHGIVVADFVSGSLISGNVVTGSHDHGIVVYQFSDNNRIVGNTVSRSFDGIVIVDSSHNVIDQNSVSASERFAIRLSGSASSNVVSRNVLRKAIVGIYVYRGAGSNRLLNNSFTGMYENVRIRSDAPGNSVSPNPGRSEL